MGGHARENISKNYFWKRCFLGKTLEWDYPAREVCKGKVFERVLLEAKEGGKMFSKTLVTVSATKLTKQCDHITPIWVRGFV